MPSQTVEPKLIEEPSGAELLDATALLCGKYGAMVVVRIAPLTPGVLSGIRAQLRHRKVMVRVREQLEGTVLIFEVAP